MTMAGRTQVQSTAVDAYKSEGGGIGAGSGALDWLMENSELSTPSGLRCLEIGCGAGELVARLAASGNKVIGVDIAEKCIECVWSQVKKNLVNPKLVQTYLLDISHEPLQIKEDSIDIAFCTETIEHLSNPYHMFAEVKRVLRHEGHFVMAYPMPENNLGCGGGQHAHVYPGFLLRDSFERFCKQMYFKIVVRTENGSSAWYLLKNYKAEGIVDPFCMIAGNYEEEDLYGCLNNF